MPRAPKVCTVAGCSRPTYTSRCDIHTTQARRASDKRRPNARARGYDRKWEHTRAEHLRLEPNCRQCGAPGRHVDHIDGGGPLAPNGHDHANLQTLCASCHSRKTNAQDGGGWGGTARA